MLEKDFIDALKELSENKDEDVTGALLITLKKDGTWLHGCNISIYDLERCKNYIVSQQKELLEESLQCGMKEEPSLH